eukprot:TRINITY_DN5180_c1_g2_i2.p1 TRINITY_DN5180_c1_g2~~TRINITY_DN5180_c1_g2_i2.p1  ORF type:complete len:668 (+),score=253.49 TRINITY_DN5180_c1_g2_i2:35-2038(+)
MAQQSLDGLITLIRTSVHDILLQTKLTKETYDPQEFALKRDTILGYLDSLPSLISHPASQEVVISTTRLVKITEKLIEIKNNNGANFKKAEELFRNEVARFKHSFAALTLLSQKQQGGGGDQPVQQQTTTTPPQQQRTTTQPQQQQPQLNKNSNPSQAPQQSSTPPTKPETPSRMSKPPGPQSRASVLDMQRQRSSQQAPLPAGALSKSNPPQQSPTNQRPLNSSNPPTTTTPTPTTTTTTTSTATPNKTTSTTSTNAPAAVAQPPSTSWICTTCKTSNSNNTPNCSLCSSKRTVPAGNASNASTALSSSSASQWVCPTCNTKNPVKTPNCALCSTKRPASTTAAAAAAGGLSTPNIMVKTPQSPTPNKPNPMSTHLGKSPASSAGSGGVNAKPPAAVAATSSAPGWLCTTCKTNNSATAPNCSLCSSKRPANSASATNQPQKPQQPTQPKKAAAWTAGKVAPRPPPTSSSQSELSEDARKILEDDSIVEFNDNEEDLYGDDYGDGGDGGYGGSGAGDSNSNPEQYSSLLAQLSEQGISKSIILNSDPELLINLLEEKFREEEDLRENEEKEALRRQLSQLESLDDDLLNGDYGTNDGDYNDNYGEFNDGGNDTIYNDNYGDSNYGDGGDEFGEYGESEYAKELAAKLAKLELELLNDGIDPDDINY